MNSDIWELILKIIRLILGGVSASQAVTRVSQESSVGFSELWDKLPSKYK